MRNPFKGSQKYTLCENKFSLNKTQIKWVQTHYYRVGELCDNQLYSASSLINSLCSVMSLRKALQGLKRDVFDSRAINVQKPRDRITGLRYSNSSQIPARIRLRNQILAGLASLVTTSLIPFNDIKSISAP